MTQIPDQFWQGVEQFNQGQFYDCHDTLEALWIEATEPLKSLYQGILQIAVALYHLGNSNWRGAVILLGEGINRLQRYPSTYAGIDIDDLLMISATLLTTLQQLGAGCSSDLKLENEPLTIIYGEQTLALPKIKLAQDEEFN